jgi:hypothetical protein
MIVDGDDIQSIKEIQYIDPQTIDSVHIYDIFKIIFYQSTEKIVVKINHAFFDGWSMMQLMTYIFEGMVDKHNVSIPVFKCIRGFSEYCILKLRSVLL